MKEVAIETSVTSVLASATIMMAALIVLSLIAMTLMYRYFNKVSRQQNQIIEELKKEMDIIALGVRNSEKRHIKSDNKFKQLARRQYLYEVQQMKSRDYARAKNMVSRGEDLKTVLASCNITKTEAELILLANKMNKVA